MSPISILICSEVLEGLKTLSDNSIDVIITSPPYNIGYGEGKMGSDLTGHLYGEENYDFMDENEYQAWLVQSFSMNCIVFSNQQVRCFSITRTEPKLRSKTKTINW